MKAIVTFVLLFSYSPLYAKEYQMATLISFETVSTGEDCNRGLVSDLKCKEQLAPVYTIRLGDRTLKIRVKYRVMLDKDPLIGARPGQEFRVRVDRATAWIAETTKKGKTVEEEYAIVGEN